MNKYIFLFAILVMAQFEISAQNVVELEPAQNMLMTGKEPGQNATINPFEGKDCIAIVENLGKGNVSIRIQKKGEILNTIPAKEGETKKVKLLEGQEMYIDSESDQKSKVKISYETIE